MKQTFTLSALLIGLVFTALSSGNAMAAGGPKFLSSYEAAVEKGRKTGKPVIVIFSASWCPPCQQMKNSVYPSRQVSPFHDQFIWAYLDADKASNSRVMRKYRTRGIPHIVFLKPDGSSVGSLRGAVSPDSFARTLKSVLKKS